MDQLISLKSTGSLKELTEKLDVSQRTTSRLLDFLKEMECPIYYNKEKRNYGYKSLGKLIMQFKGNHIDKEGFEKIVGGCKPFSHSIALWWQSGKGINFFSVFALIVKFGIENCFVYSIGRAEKRLPWL